MLLHLWLRHNNLHNCLLAGREMINISNTDIEIKVILYQLVICYLVDDKINAATYLEISQKSATVIEKG